MAIGNHATAAMSSPRVIRFYETFKVRFYEIRQGAKLLTLLYLLFRHLQVETSRQVLDKNGEL
jgi:hypothetical protein